MINAAIATSDKELVHSVEGQGLIEDVVVNAEICLVHSCDCWNIRDWEELFADGCRAWRLYLDA